MSYQFQAMTLLATQEPSNAYLVDLFEDVNVCAIHANCVTIQANSIHFALCICGERCETNVMRLHFAIDVDDEHYSNINLL